MLNTKRSNIYSCRTQNKWKAQRETQRLNAAQPPTTTPRTSFYDTSHSGGPCIAPVCAIRKYRYYRSNRHYSAYCHHRLFPPVPSDTMGTITGNRHYSPALYRDNHCTPEINLQKTRHVVLSRTPEINTHQTPTRNVIPPCTPEINT